ncbi:hypothetical protein B6I21_01090 [candidate division KSB1 bacterium 4572_119]|nr:MAG: hypothetical protein B6I21_01090 [candidate division KSB1 bacterium 4572_119]
MKMNRIFKEYGYQQSGCTSVECLVEIGQMLSARKIVGGSVGKLGKKYIINLQLVNVESSEMEKLVTENYVGAIEELDFAIKKAANKLMGEDSYASDQAVIFVSSVPAGARVYLNSVFKGNCPLKLPAKLHTRYEVRVNLSGYSDWQQTVNVNRKEPIILNAVLAELRGEQPGEGGARNIRDLSEWELMGISRDEWVKFKRNGLIYDDWIRYKPLGLTVDDIIHFNELGLLDSLLTSLEKGIGEWELMGISSEKWIEFKQAGLTFQDWEKYSPYGFDADKLIILSKLGNSSLREGIKVYGQKLLKMNLSIADLNAWQVKVKNRIRMNSFLLSKFEEYKDKKNSKTSLDYWVKTLDPFDYEAYKKSGDNLTQWILDKFNELETPQPKNKLTNESPSNLEGKKQTEDSKEFKKWQKEVKDKIFVNRFLNIKWNEYKKKKGLNLSLADWTKTLKNSDYQNYKKSGENLTQWILDRFNELK